MRSLPVSASPVRFAWRVFVGVWWTTASSIATAVGSGVTPVSVAVPQPPVALKFSPAIVTVCTPVV